jgi:hypothetical protein
MTPDRGFTAGLPRRDLAILPALVLFTLLSMAGLGELVAQWTFVESGYESCSTTTGAGAGAMRPNCTSYRKAAEGPPTVNTYNDCGYRAPQPCGTKPDGTIRVALMGASTAQGLKAVYETTFAARLSGALTRACGRPVEFQNMGVAGATLLDIYRRTGEALAMHPDMVLIVFTPYEMKARMTESDMRQRREPVHTEQPAGGTQAGGQPAAKSLVARISDIAAGSRLLVVAQHYLFQDRGSFVRLFMLHGEDADYLRVPYKEGWEARLRDLDTLLGEMAGRFRDAGVPAMLALGPQRIQTSLLDPAFAQPNADPRAIGRRIGDIATRHGVLFQDTLDGFARTSDPDAMFYAVDGHMDAAGHGVFAGAVLQAMLDRSPLFQKCNRAAVGTL